MPLHLKEGHIEAGVHRAVLSAGEDGRGLDLDRPGREGLCGPGGPQGERLWRHEVGRDWYQRRLKVVLTTSYLPLKVKKKKDPKTSGSAGGI